MGNFPVLSCDFHKPESVLKGKGKKMKLKRDDPVVPRKKANIAASGEGRYMATGDSVHSHK